MTVAQPEVLIAFNDASGDTVTNDGTIATDGSVGQGTEDTDWAWNQDAGSFLGYWESFDAAGSNQAWIDLTGITGMASTSITHRWMAIGFYITGYDTRVASIGRLVGGNGSGGGDAGTITVDINDPTSTGDFNLDIRCLGGILSADTSYTYEDLDFSTDYQLVVCLDATTVTASVLKTKLNSASVVSQSPANYNSETFKDNPGYIGRSADYSNYYGIIGRVYYYMLASDVLLSDSDMADINSNPANVTGWPGGGGDSTAPTYDTDPALDSRGDTTATVDATASDETASQVDHYAALYTAGSTPDASDVKAGSGTGLVSGSAKSDLAVTSGAEGSMSWTGLTPATAYRAAYTVEEQGGGNLATVQYVDFSTTETFTGQGSVADAQASGETPLLTNPISVRIDISDRYQTDRINLTSLSWSWFDEDDAGTLAAPTDQGTSETTDSNAELAVVLNNTTLASSQYGRLVLESNDKAWTAMYRIQIP